MINDWKLCGIYKFIVHTTTIFVLNIKKNTKIMFKTKMNLKITLTLRIAKYPPPLYQSLPTSEPHFHTN